MQVRVWDEASASCSQDPASVTWPLGTGVLSQVPDHPALGFPALVWFPLLHQACGSQAPLDSGAGPGPKDLPGVQCGGPTLQIRRNLASDDVHVQPRTLADACFPPGAHDSDKKENHWVYAFVVSSCLRLYHDNKLRLESSFFFFSPAQSMS